MPSCTLRSLSAATLGLTLFVSSALAEPLLVDDPAACDRIATEDGMLDFAGEGGLILDRTGFSSLEYFCQFQSDLVFDWTGYKVTTLVGHCETPGPDYTPGLFTFVMSQDEPGIAVLYDGSSDPHAFYLCRD